jgi:hypothetical protein
MDLNGDNIHEVNHAINNALSSLMVVTEELDIEILI